MPLSVSLALWCWSPHRPDSLGLIMPSVWGGLREGECCLEMAASPGEGDVAPCSPQALGAVTFLLLF